MTGGLSGRHCGGRHFGGQYLTGLCLAGLGVCAAGWLVVTALAFAGPVPGTRGGGWNHAAVATLATGAVLAVVAVVTFVSWAQAWRHVLRADGALAGAGEPEPVRPANADRVLTDLRDRLGPLTVPVDIEEKW